MSSSSYFSAVNCLGFLCRQTASVWLLGRSVVFETCVLWGSWCFCSQTFTPSRISTLKVHVSPRSIPTGSWCPCSHLFRYCLLKGTRSLLIFGVRFPRPLGRIRDIIVTFYPLCSLCLYLIFRVQQFLLGFYMVYQGLGLQNQLSISKHRIPVTGAVSAHGVTVSTSPQDTFSVKVAGNSC